MILEDLQGENKTPVFVKTIMPGDVTIFGDDEPMTLNQAIPQQNDTARL